MKKIISVQRMRDRTIVVYKDPPKPRAIAPEMRQKAVPVKYMGKVQYWIMPDGRTVTPRRASFINRIIQHVTAWSVILMIPAVTAPYVYA